MYKIITKSEIRYVQNYWLLIEILYWMAVTHFQISKMHAKRSEVFVNVDEKSTDLQLSKFGFRSAFNSSMMLRWAVMIVPVIAVVMAIVTVVLLATGTLRLTNLSIPTYHPGILFRAWNCLFKAKVKIIHINLLEQRRMLLILYNSM